MIEEIGLQKEGERSP